MKFEVYQQSARTLLGGGDWRWRLRASNGEVIAQGEGYRNQADCLHAISLVKSASLLTPIFGENGMQLIG